MAFYDLVSESTIASLQLYIIHSSPLRFKGKGHRHHLSMGRVSKNLQLCLKSPREARILKKEPL